ncbi:MAG: xylulokinase, partial [Planctomycetota bacterium]|jgi:sugar (pentulose or hexulose) kinase
MLAAVGCGAVSSAKEAAGKWVTTQKTFTPNKEKNYKQRYDIYKDLYKTIKPIGEKLNKLT